MEKTVTGYNDHLFKSQPLSEKEGSSYKIALVGLVSFMALSCIVLGALAIVSSHYGFGSSLPFIANIGWEGGVGLLIFGLTTGVGALLYCRSLLHSPAITLPSSTSERGAKVSVANPEAPKKKKLVIDLSRTNLLEEDIALLELTEDIICLFDLSRTIYMSEGDLLKITLGDFEKQYTAIQKKIIAQRLARMQPPPLEIYSNEHVSPEMTLETMRKKRLYSTDLSKFSPSVYSLFSTNQWAITIYWSKEVLPTLSFPVTIYLIEKEDKDFIWATYDLKQIPKSYLKHVEFPWNKFLKRGEIWDFFKDFDSNYIPWNAITDEHIDNIWIDEIFDFPFLKHFPLDILKRNADKFCNKNLCKLLFFLHEDSKFPWKEVVFSRKGFFCTLYDMGSDFHKVSDSIPWELAPPSFIEDSFFGDSFNMKNSYTYLLVSLSLSTIDKIISLLPQSLLLELPFRYEKNFPWQLFIKRVEKESFSEKDVTMLAELIPIAPLEHSDFFQKIIKDLEGKI